MQVLRIKIPRKRTHRRSVVAVVGRVVHDEDGRVVQTVGHVRRVAPGSSLGDGQGDGGVVGYGFGRGNLCVGGRVEGCGRFDEPIDSLGVLRVELSASSGLARR